jgi:hypothetical protein
MVQLHFPFPLDLGYGPDTSQSTVRRVSGAVRLYWFQQLPGLNTLTMHAPSGKGDSPLADDRTLVHVSGRP